MGGNVLFLCTSNSARSILAEALLNRLGEGVWRGFSAGSFPKGEVHPMALQLLAGRGFPTGAVRTCAVQSMALGLLAGRGCPTWGRRWQGWRRFAAAAAPPLGRVSTVCDTAAWQPCRGWRRKPARKH